ncbi:hypothetical protein L7F22_029658 [Adiantum nelumboides]|nr:hypothetical protein [Adiantum nelumboides]
MASSSAFEDTLRRCVEGLDLKDGASCPTVLCGKGLRQGEKKRPWQGVRVKQQGRISKQSHRRSSKGNVKTLPANESNFKALVIQHTCMPSSNTPHVIVEPTSPLSFQSNSSVSTWGSLSEVAGVSMSQPASPNTPTSSRPSFTSQPTSPLSHSRPTFFSPPAASTRTRNENGVPRHCASAPCLDGNHHQVGWPDGTSSPIFTEWDDPLTSWRQSLTNQASFDV